MHFLASTFIFVLLQLPMIVLSLIAVPVLLLTRWDGKTTWFGNWKYGRGDTHYAYPASGVFWRQWWFLCIRNPVSNFGKQVLAVKDAPWVWLNDTKVVGRFHWKYGWKLGETRTFVYRPWLHQK